MEVGLYAGVTDPQSLRKVLDGVRLRGCAIEDEESEIGMRARVSCGTQGAVSAGATKPPNT